MKIIEVNKENFEEEVLNAKEMVLADFNAEWCGPCKMMKPILEEISGNIENCKIVSINIDDEDELTEKYEVSAIPCLVIFKDGKEVTRNVGFMAKDNIEAMIGGQINV